MKVEWGLYSIFPGFLSIIILQSITITSWIVGRVPIQFSCLFAKLIDRYHAQITWYVISDFNVCIFQRREHQEHLTWFWQNCSNYAYLISWLLFTVKQQLLQSQVQHLMPKDGSVQEGFNVRAFIGSSWTFVYARTLWRRSKIQSTALGWLDKLKYFKNTNQEDLLMNILPRSQVGLQQD